MVKIENLEQAKAAAKELAEKDPKLAATLTGIVELLEKLKEHGPKFEEPRTVCSVAGSPSLSAIDKEGEAAMETFRAEKAVIDAEIGKMKAAFIDKINTFKKDHWKKLSDEAVRLGFLPADTDPELDELEIDDTAERSLIYTRAVRETVARRF